MVSSQSFGLLESNVRKYHKYQLNLTIPSPDSASAEHAEFDFSDVFGSPPALSSAEAKLASPIVAILGPEDPNEKVFEDPVIIQRRSHSLVGPTAHVSQLLDIKSLAIHESDSSTECIPEDTAGEADEVEKCEGGENSQESGNPKGVGLEDFDIMKMVGQGAFGKVYQVNMKGTSEIYAMKVMRKDKIMEKNHVEYMKAERDILTKIDHPFVVQLRYSFQTKYRLYLVFDFINGGHLFFQLYRQVLFSEDLARVYTAEIVSAVSHLHENGIMHRDLKPENILVGADGHVVLTDFGLAKQFDENTRSNSMCGTVEYMAPEIILGKGHNKAADWWSVGILLFEMLTGKPPFMGGNRNRIQQKVIKEKIKLPNYLTAEAHSLLKGLLQKESNRRLGSGPDGANEIKKHKWFKSINWKKLQGKEVMPSFVPSVDGKQCIANFEEKWTKMPLLDSPVSSPVGDDPFNFPGFTYVRPSRFRP